MEVGCLQDGTDAAGRARDLLVRHSEDRRGAAGGLVESKQHAQRCRLACSVGSQEAGYRPALQAERQVVDSDDAAEPLAQVLDGDDVLTAIAIA